MYMVDWTVLIDTAIVVVAGMALAVLLTRPTEEE